MAGIETKPRVDWVDYAKGICIVLVVMMHSTLGVEKAASAVSSLNSFIEWARPFRMPDFPVHSLRPWLIGVRPLLMFSYWVNYQLSGLETYSYHAFNVLFHAINAVSIFLIVRKILDWAGVDKDRLDILAGFAGGIVDQDLNWSKCGLRGIEQPRRC